MNNNKKYKKKIVLAPSAYKSSVLGDVAPFIEYYKNDFDVYLISDMHSKEIICEDGVYYVNNKSDYAKYLIFTSDYIIDAGATAFLTKVSTSQKRVSVWHGIPYKKMFTQLDVKNVTPSLNYAMAYDLMLSPSKYYSDDFLKKSMLYDGEIYETTMPRLKYILDNDNEENITRIKNKLNIPLDKKIVLYAPTLRETEKYKVPCNFNKIKNNFGNEWFLISKSHYMNSLKNISGIDMDFSDYSNINDLLLISDVVITDYSSLIFDYSVLDRQLILFQYDLDEYSSERGFMFDIKDYVDEEAVVTTASELYTLCRKIGNEKISYDTCGIADKFYEHRNKDDMDKIIKKLDFDSTNYGGKEVTFVINELNQIGGVHTFIYNLAKEFKKHINCKVNVVAIKDSNTENSKFYKFDPDNLFDVKASNDRLGGLCSSLLTETDGYIITCQFSAHVHFQKYFEGKNVIAMFHGDMKEVVQKTLYHWHLDAINNQKIHNYKKFLTLTPKNEELLKKYVKSDEIKNVISSMGNSIDFSDSKKLFKKSKTYVSVTRLDNDKNIFALIDIFKNSNLDGDIKLHVYGDGPLKNEFELKLKEANLEDRIILKGFSTCKEEIYKDKQGLVFTSKSEGFPLIILEASKYYIPTILFDGFTSASEIVGEIGKVIDIDDFDTFAKTLNNPIELSDDIFEKHHQQNENKTIVNKWIELFEEIDQEKTLILEKSYLRKKHREFKEKMVHVKYKIVRFIRRNLKNNIRRHLINVYRATQFYKSGTFLIKQPLVSVIMPYYYSSETIGDSLKSLKRLKYKNIEIIIVNDGSDDYTPPKNSKIKYFALEKNIGPGEVRNFGISKATGKYMVFLDSDDRLNKYGMHFMVDYAEKNNLEVVSGITRRLDLSTNVSHIWFPGIYNKTYINSVSNRHLMLPDVLSTNKLYNVEAYKKHDIKFESGLYEDKLFTADLYKKVDKIGIIKKDYYVWYFYGSNSSISTSLSVENFYERISKYNSIMELTNDYYRVNYTSFLVNHDFQIYFNIFDLYTDEDKIKIFNGMREMLLKWIDFYYIEYVNRIIGKALVLTLLNNDYERFNTIATLVSKQYLEDSKK